MKKTQPITVLARNCRNSGYMKFCDSYQVQWWQIVLCYDPDSFRDAKFLYLPTVRDNSIIIQQKSFYDGI